MCLLLLLNNLDLFCFNQVKYLRASLGVGAFGSCLLLSRMDLDPLLNAFNKGVLLNMFNKGLVFSFGCVSLPSLAILPALVFLRLGLSLGMPIASVLSLALSSGWQLSSWSISKGGINSSITT